MKVLPTYPLTIAVLAKDNADPSTGLEYGTNIGDTGFILKLSDGAVISSKWKAKNFFKGPLNGDAKNPKVLHTPSPPTNFIWSEDLDLDNTVIFRYTAPKPASFTKTWTADVDIDITNTVSELNLPTLTAPHLFSVNRNGLATGYVTRVRGSQQLTDSSPKPPPA